jgi:DNA-binding transcriptional ArsR family regulator
MSDSDLTLPAAREATVLLDPEEVLSCVADPARYRILKALADSPTPLSVSDLAARIGRSVDLTAKHLRVMRAARVVMNTVPPGDDGRKNFHKIPEPFFARDAAGQRVLDFGCVALRV